MAGCNRLSVYGFVTNCRYPTPTPIEQGRRGALVPHPCSRVSLESQGPRATGIVRCFERKSHGCFIPGG